MVLAGDEAAHHAHALAPKAARCQPVGAVQNGLQRKVPRADRSDEPSAETALEPVNPPQAILAMRELRFEDPLRLIRDAPQIVGHAAEPACPAHGFPLEQVRRHLVSALVGGGAVQIPRRPSPSEDHQGRQRLPPGLGQQQLALAPRVEDLIGKAVIGRVMDAEGVALSGVLHQSVERPQVVPRADLDAFSLRQADVVARLGMHPAQELVLIAGQINKKAAARLNRLAAREESCLAQALPHGVALGGIRFQLKGEGSFRVAGGDDLGEQLWQPVTDGSPWNVTQCQAGEWAAEEHLRPGVVDREFEPVSSRSGT